MFDRIARMVRWTLEFDGDDVPLAAWAFFTFAIVQFWAQPALVATDDPTRRIQGPVIADVVEVRDGDTVEVRAHVWPGHVIEVAVRLRGIDTPEHRGKCEAEKAAADRAEAHLRQLVGPDRVELTGIEGGKYFGRVIADLAVGPAGAREDAAEALKKKGLARDYGGGKREGWCSAGS